MKPRPGGNDNDGVAGAVLSNVVSLGTLIAPAQSEKLKEILGAIYAVVYVLLGFAAIVTWAYLRYEPNTPGCT
jgi:hypothetical protein